MEIRVLGPVEVGVEEELVALGGPKQRALFALLVAAVPDLVSTDGLIDGLWGEKASPGARSTLQTYVSNLRQVLGDVLVHERGGYRLAIDPAKIDAVEFARALEDARVGMATDPEDVAVGLRRALALWRGRPFADLVDVPSLEPETRRLEALRLEAVELRIDAELACGRHAEVLAELEALAEEHPTREHFRAQHMLALYRAGRQADALRAYRRSETYLAETLGVDPSEELQDLELRILDHDGSLRVGASRAVTQRLAFMVSEIEGSTRLWDRFPQAMVAALVAHDRILGEEIEAAGGRMFKHTGEGAVAVFPDAVAAVAAAEAVLSRLAGSDWGEIGEVRVRIGVDVGEAEARGDDFFGPPLNRSSRLCAIGHGGQVLLSSAAERDVTASAPPGLQIRHLGEVPLRGMATPERVSQLVFSGLPADFPDLRLDAASRLDDRADAMSLPGYEVRELIGEGTFGVVWRAYQPSVGREVAIKIVRSEFAGRPSFVRRFEAEARTVARLAHPHIVPLIDFWRDAAGAYLVLQLLPGGSLREALAAGRPDQATARRILNQLGEALDHAHAQGVIHGDFQPANILLDGTGNAYLSDFGIAARLVDPELVASMSSAPDFRAPEEPSTGPTKGADLFSFGILALQLLGDRPELEELLARATSPNAEDRYPSAAALLGDLDEALGKEPSELERPAVSRNPYKGLRAFDESDAPDFHGRDELVTAMTAALDQQRLVTVVGPSGSGKSSAVQAGLLPALAAGVLEGSERWFRAVLTPGSQPLESLVDALQAVAAEPVDLLGPLEDGDLTEAAARILGDIKAELVVVIDQFEEVFTLVEDSLRREAFLDLVVEGVHAEGSRVRVVATLRADFYDRPLEHAGLDRLVRDGLVTVLRPSPEELLEMIARPAHAVGLRWEPGLPHRIAQDVADQPGGLPLLQYALTELVERRRGDLLTHDDYRRIGGVAGALATRAETVFRELTPPRQEAARQVLLRLVTVDEDTDATRRRVRRRELESLGIDRSDLEMILEAFTAERLLLADRDPVTRGPTVEVAHEALLRDWPRLRSWIGDQREALLLGRRLRAAMAEWEAAEQEGDYLLTGSRLAPFLAWAESSSLSADERAFLEASKERDGADRRAAARRRRVLTGVLASAALVATFLASVAVVQGARARTEAERAVAAEQQAEAAAELAEQQAGLARREAELSRGRELTASSAAVLDEDPELAILLALEAAHLFEGIGEPLPPETVQTLHEATQASRLELRLEGGYGGVSFSPDGSLFATDSVSGTGDPGSDVLVWDAATGRRLAVLPGAAPAMSIVFSPNSPLLAVGYGHRAPSPGEPATVTIWNARSWEAVAHLAGPVHLLGSAEVASRPMAWSDDGALLAAVSREGGAVDTITVWEMQSQQVVTSFSLSDASDIAFLDPETLLVAEATRERVGFYSISPGRELDALETPGFVPQSLALAPDGDRLVLGSQASGAIQAWDLVTRSRLWSRSDSPFFRIDDVNSESGTVAVGGNVAVVALLDLGDGSEAMALRGHPDTVLGAAFDPSGRRLVSVGGGETLVWNVTPAGPPGSGAIPAGSEFPAHPFLSPDGTMIAYSTSLAQADLLVLDTETGDELDRLTGRIGFFLPAVISPDWRQVAWVDGDGVGRIRMLGADEAGSPLPPCTAPKAFSPDGSALLLDGVAVCGGLEEVPEGAELRSRVIDPSTGAELLDLGERLVFARGGGFNPAGAFEPGRYLAVNIIEELAVEIWDMATRSVVGRLGFPNENTYSAGQFDPNSRYLAGGTFDGRAWVLDLAELISGAETADALVMDVDAHGGAVIGHAISGQGMMATSAQQEPVRLWEVESGQLIMELDATIGSLVAFSPDGEYLYYSDLEHGAYVIRRLPLDAERLVEVAESRVTRGLSEDECRRFPSAPSCP